MLIIIAHHFAVHGVLFDVSVTTETVSYQLVCTRFFTWCGALGNAIFVLITGYFMIESRVHWKKNALLLVTMLAFSWTIEAIVYGGNFLPPTIRSVIRMTFPIWFGENWFVSCYLIFSLFLPFLNPLLLQLSKERFRLLLLLLFGVYVVVPVLGGAGFSSAPLIFFGFCYALGAYAKLHMKARISPSEASRYRNGSILLFGIILLLALSLCLLGIVLQSNFLLKQITKAGELLSIPLAATMFFYFASRKPFHSKWANRIAGTTLGIYLIHDNTLMREILWKHIFPNLDYIHSDFYLAFFLIKVLAVFLVCSVMDFWMGLWIRPAFERIWNASARWRDRIARRLPSLLGSTD